MAGPTTQDDQPVGTVFVGLAGVMDAAQVGTPPLAVVGRGAEPMWVGRDQPEVRPKPRWRSCCCEVTVRSCASVALTQALDLLRRNLLEDITCPVKPYSAPSAQGRLR